MKKTLTALGVAALMATFGGSAIAAVSLEVGAAGAGVTVLGGQQTDATTLALSRSGTGHILVVPYFTTQNGNTTLISLTNSDTKNAKALKVRFRSAVNSDDIFDFTLFMSPGDVWTAEVNKGADGRSVLKTADNSVTLPSVVSGQTFVTDRLPSYLSDEAKAAQTREGYIEILQMADVAPTLTSLGTAGATFATPAPTVGSANPLFTAVKHLKGVAPGITNANLIDALKKPITSLDDAAQFGFQAPTGGLSATWSIVNVADAAVAWSGEATAIRAVKAANADAAGRIVFSPQVGGAATEAMLDNKVSKLSADPLFSVQTGGTAPALVSQYFDYPDLSTPYTTGVAAADLRSAQAAIKQANLLSKAFAVTSVMNEFAATSQAAGAALTSSTDWTFSMPTRRYGVAMAYATEAKDNKAVYNTAAAVSAAADVPAAGDLAIVGTDALAASNYFTSSNVVTQATAGRLVISTGAASPIQTWDREENTQTSDFVISPSTVAAVRFPGEVSVLSFNNGTNTKSSVLGAEVAQLNVNTTFTEGWAKISTPGLANAGLPILGASFLKVLGPVNNGASTNFGSTSTHRFTSLNNQND